MMVLRRPVALMVAALFTLGAWNLEAQSTPRTQQRSMPRNVKVWVTAYCVDGETASGATTRKGVLAADPDWLPLGSRVRIRGLGRPHDGVYTVLDTGPAVQGREVDLFMPSCAAAKRFGRRAARLTVLRVGTGEAPSRKPPNAR